VETGFPKKIMLNQKSRRDRVAPALMVLVDDGLGG
jgi:hypothetical protein